MNTVGHHKHAQNDHIEILRAVAVLFVIIAHIRRVSWNPLNFFMPVFNNFDFTIGVDLFLVISGFVITRSLIGSMQRNTTGRRSQMLAFWVRRIFRLLPTAWLWLAVAWLLSLILRAMSGQLDLWYADLPATAAAYLNMMNLYMALCISSSDVAMCQGNMHLHGHYWSLSLEEQFYLLFPLLFFFLNKRLFVALLIIAVAAQFFWKRPMFEWWWILRTDALCWGVLLAFASYTTPYARLRAFLQRHHRLSSLLLVGALIALSYVGSDVLGRGSMKPYGVGVVSLIGAFAVLLASTEYRALNRDRLVTRAMLYIGSRSYALYVIHFIWFDFQRSAIRFSGLTITSNEAQIAFDVISCTAALLVTFALTELNYRWVEVPWRNRGRRVSAIMLQGTATSQDAPTRARIA